MQGEFVAMNTEVGVSQFLQEWLQALREMVRPTSFNIYQSEVQNHLVPLLGQKSICDLTVSTGEELQKNLLKKGLSERTVNDVVSKLGQALRWGVAHGYEVPLLKQTALKREAQGIRFLTREEQISLENSLITTSDDFSNMIVLALYAGLTIGEVCALSWKDMNLEKQEMNVHQICQRAPSGLIYSEVESRALSLPKRLQIRDDVFHNGFFVKQTKGDGCEPRLCQLWMKKHLKDNQLPEDITFITLRNTYIRSLMESGTDFIQISYLSGCKDLNFLWKKFGPFYQLGEAS